MATFQEARDGLGVLIKDGAGHLEPSEIDSIIETAAKTFQRRFPRILAYELSGAGVFDYAVTGITGWVEGFSAIQDVYFPYLSTDQNPPRLETKDWRIWDTPTGRMLRFLSDTPGASDKALVVFTAPHTADADTGIVNEDTTLSVAGTFFSVEGVSLAVADTESARAAQISIHITDAPAAQDGRYLEVAAEISKDGTQWAEIARSNQIAAAGDYVIQLSQEMVGGSVRVRYVPIGGGTWTLEAVLTQGVAATTLTIEDSMMDVFLYLCAHLASNALASYYAGLASTQLEGDVTDYAGKSSYWEERSKSWDKKWNEERAAAPKKKKAGSSALGEFDLDSSSGDYMLTHDRRLR